MFSGVTANTPQKLQLDAGAFLKNYDPATDTWATAKATKLLGATAGGGNFGAVPTIRRIEVDGVKGATKGFQTIDEWVVTMTVNMKELDAEIFKLALATGSTADAKSPSSVTANNYTKVTAANQISSSDYITNIAWVGTLSGNSLPIIIILKNALCTNGLSISPADKAEGVVTLTFTGHYDPSNLDEVPFEIYYPKASS